MGLFRGGKLYAGAEFRGALFGSSGVVKKGGGGGTQHDYDSFYAVQQDQEDLVDILFIVARHIDSFDNL
jgi:hypothetical protein